MSLTRDIWIVASLLATACGRARTGGLADGHWTGDLTKGEGTLRLEITVDSGGRRVTVDAPSWQLASAVASRSGPRGDSARFTVLTGTDTTVLTGIAGADDFKGQAHRGSDVRGFEVRRIHQLTAREWQDVFGTYRAPDGGLIGISPFAEFGPTPQLVDFRTGRIGALFPIAAGTFLVAHSLIAPLFPADTAYVMRDPSGAVVSVRLVARGQPAVEAVRVATRDEEVQFTNGDVTLQGTLTLPAEPGPHPALVIVHGSGPLSRDHLGPWQRFFPGLGFAVLSYDKRGTGTSTGDWKTADFAALAGDVLAGVRLLAARKDIRRDKIGLWGISQGGWILPLATATAPSEIAFLIVHSGTGTTVREQGILNLQNEYRFRGASDSAIAIATRYRIIDDSVTKTGRGWDVLQRYYNEHKDQTVLTEPQPADAWFRPYYRMLMDFDPAASWAKVKVPILLFYGELDANVPPRESWPPIERGLRQAGNSRVSHYVLPGANHVLLEAKTGASSEYPALSRFVPGYFDRMAEWLRQFRTGG